MTKRELLEVVWAGVVVSDGVIKEHVREIRRALEDAPKEPRFIQTVHRLGYRFVCAVEPGASQLVLVTGEAGIGKTTLISEFLATHCSASRCWVASGQCVEQYGSGSAYLPFLEALRQLCLGAEQAEVLRLLSAHAPDWLQYLPLACAQERATQAPGQPVPVTPERLLRQIYDAILALSAVRPVLLVVEDLQWIDPSTLHLISYLAQRLVNGRLLIVGTYRSGDIRLTEHPVWALHQHLLSRGQCVELGLGRLLPPDVENYLASELRRQELPAQLVHRVYQVSSGNPLFMVRVVDDLLMRTALRGEDGLARDLTSVELRLLETVLAMISWEVERVSQPDRDVLEAAAVAGFEFTTRGVASALQRDLVEVEALCNRWVRQRRFFEVAEDADASQQRPEYRFTHSLYREVIYHQLGLARRARLHGLHGLHLEKEHAQRARPIAAALSIHFTLAGDGERAIRYGRMAGQHALAHGAYSEAIMHLRGALELLERTPELPDSKEQELALLLELRAPLVATLGYGAIEIEQLYERAAQRAATMSCTPSSLSVEAGRSLLYLVRGRLEDALRSAQRCLVLAGANDGWRREAHAAAAVASYFQGDFQVAATHVASAIAGEAQRGAALFHNETGLIANFYGSFLAWHRGESDEGLALAQASLRLARASEEPFAIAAALHHHTVLFLCLRDGDLVTRHAGELAALCTDHGFTYYGCLAAIRLGAAAIYRGDLDAGISGMSDALARLRAMGAEIGRSHWAADLAEGYAARGELQAAFHALSDSFESVETRGERFWEPELYRVHGELCAALPRRPRGAAKSPCGLSLDPEASFELALELARKKGSRPLELRAARSWDRFRGTRRGHRTAPHREPGQ